MLEEEEKELDAQFEPPRSCTRFSRSLQTEVVDSRRC